MEKKHGIIVTIAVLFISLVNIETSLINSALADIAKAFPDTAPTLISLISTLPVIVMVPMIILSGKLCYYFSKKTLLIIGLTIYVIGGVGGAFINASIFQVLFMRGLLGIGAGLATPLGTAIIADIFEESQRPKLIGWSNAFGSAVAFIMTWLGGLLCVINWKYTFLAYLVFAVILIFEILALPKMKPEKEYKIKETNTGEKPKLGVPVVILAGAVLIVLLFGMLLMLKLAIFIADNQIGNALTTATAFNFYSAGAIVIGTIFVTIFKNARRFTPTIGLVCMALAFFIIMNAHSSIPVYIGMFVNGVGGGIFMPYIFTKSTMIGTKATQSFIIGLVMQAQFLGQFLGTFLESVVNFIFGNASIKFLYTFGGCSFLVFAAINILWVILKKDYADTRQEAA